MDVNQRQISDKIKRLNTQIDKAKSNRFRPAIQPVETFTAKELDEEDISPPDWIIEGLLPVGLTLLAGAPKVGKTRLVTQIGLGVSTGVSIFEKIPVVTSGVLCLFLEDSKWRIKDRLSGQQDGDFPQNLHLSHRWPRMEEGGLDALDNWLPQHLDVRLVIIDILGKFTSLSSSKNIYQGDYDKIEKIKVLADRHTIAIIVVHHLNKLKESSDVFDKISGSTGLTGASDTVAVLERYNRSGADAKLHIAGRDVEAAELPLRYDSQRGLWLYAGDAQKYCTTEERVKIFELLEMTGRPMRSKDIADALGKNHNTVRGLLVRMAKKGELKQPGRGLYIIP